MKITTLEKVFNRVDALSQNCFDQNVYVKDISFENLDSVAERGEDALDLLYQHKPDLVLLDIMLPGIDGYEVCEIIRLNPNYRNTKIIFLTAKGREVEIAKGLALGADAYITKPFSNAALVAKIKELLEETSEKAEN